MKNVYIFTWDSAAGRTVGILTRIRAPDSNRIGHLPNTCAFRVAYPL